jgi:deazaflavin-dependent oxidoreductase (nitroreductase family)
VGRLRHVDPQRRRAWPARVLLRLASTSFMAWLARRRIWAATVWPLDRVLLRVTGGRLSTGLVLPTALLQTTGARTDLPRRAAVIYFHDGDRVTIVASQAGLPGNPSWYHNLRANPEVLLAGMPFRAELVEDAQTRERLWAAAARVLPAFARYRETAERAGRTIPIIQLVPR